MDDNAGIKGHGVVEVIGPDGKVKDTATFDNLVTQVGDQFYGERAAGIASPPAQVTAMKLGTGTTAADKTGAGAALVTYLADSQQAMDSGFPASSLETVGADDKRRIQWQVTYAAGKATGDSISEAVLVNDAIADATSPEANTISRAVFDSPVNKTVDDSLKVTWNHDLLGT